MSMRFKQLPLLFLALLLSRNSFSADAVPSTCPNFSLLDEGKSMAKVPTRDQGDTGLCDAFASASAIDAWRLSNDPSEVKFLTSPHELAVQAAADSSKKDRSIKVFTSGMTGANAVDGTAYLTNAIVSTKKDGICSYDAFGVNFENHVGPSNQNGFWSELTDDYRNWRHIYLAALMDDDKTRQTEILNSHRIELAGLLCHFGFSGEQVQLQDLKTIKDFIQAKDPLFALSTLSKKLCEGRSASLPADFPKPIAFSYQMLPASNQSYQARKQVYGGLIDAMFNFSNKQPVLIGYCAEVLTNFSAVGINPFSGANEKEKCGAHAGLIVGRAPLSDGRCGVIIRNSWGTDRDSEHGIYEQMDDKGDILVPEEALFNNLVAVSVIPPRGETYKPPKDLYRGLEAQPNGVGSAYPMMPAYPSYPAAPTNPSGSGGLQPNSQGGQ